MLFPKTSLNRKFTVQHTYFSENLNNLEFHWGASIYYVSIILDFFWPFHPLKVLNQHQYSTELPQNWQFSRPHPPSSLLTWYMVPCTVLNLASIWHYKLHHNILYLLSKSSFYETCPSTITQIFWCEPCCFLLLIRAKNK